MRETVGLFGARRERGSGKAGRIKGWVSRVFGLGAGTPMTVVELRCTEPGCPPVETVIAILDVPGSPRQYKVHKPMSEVTFEDVQRLADSESETGVAGSREKEA